MVLPWPLMSLVDRSLGRLTEAKFWEIKMIGLAIFFGTMVVFFGPLIGWRCLVSTDRHGGGEGEGWDGDRHSQSKDPELTRMLSRRNSGKPSTEAAARQIQG